MKGDWQQRPEKMGSFLPKGGLLESRGKQPSPGLELCRAQSASNYQAHRLCPFLVGRTHAPCSPSRPRFFPLFLPSSLHSLPPSLCLWVGPNSASLPWTLSPCCLCVLSCSLSSAPAYVFMAGAVPCCPLPWSKDASFLQPPPRSTSPPPPLQPGNQSEKSLEAAALGLKCTEPWS